jgi:excinuclease ABC subunit C
MFDLKYELNKLPAMPGVYIMKDEFNNIIYVGKAISLKNRVRQYFQSGVGHSEKVRAMVSHITSFEYIITDNEKEALILECTLIKKHKPQYNILLKDDKSYPYIKVTWDEEFPRVMMVRRMKKDKGQYFGPYHSMYSVRETLEELKKIFPLKTCNKILPKDIGKGRPCLNYYIGRCLGPCREDVDREEYLGMIKDVCKFLDGKGKDILDELNKKMMAASEKLEFEKAAVIRNRIAALNKILENQKVVFSDLLDRDIVAMASDDNDCCVQVFFIRKGKIIGREHFLFPDKEMRFSESETDEDLDTDSDASIIASFIKQFYYDAIYIPKEIIILTEFAESKVVGEWLSEKRGNKVSLIFPKRGKTLHLVKMVELNASEELHRFKEKIVKEDMYKNKIFAEMQATGVTCKFPKRIEAYDISNIGDCDMVGSMVVAINLQLVTKEYKRFKIKGEIVQNDYACMQEILRRRKTRLDENEKGFENAPDIIFVDGGIGHVKAAKEVFDNIAVFGMVKDDKHKTRALVDEFGKEIEIKNYRALYRFVTNVQDEAHRFAIAYNKSLGKKRYQTSALDEIDGIGAARKKELVKYFGSIAAIRQAGIDDLSAAKGISEELAQKIYKHFRK